MEDHHEGKHHQPENHDDVVRHLSPYPPPPPFYKPKPYVPKQKELPSLPYQFQYIADSYSGSKFQTEETIDDQGRVLGSYTVNLPDGRTQIVTYKAGLNGEFVADIKYEGEAVYPWNS